MFLQVIYGPFANKKLEEDSQPPKEKKYENKSS